MKINYYLKLSDIKNTNQVFIQDFADKYGLELDILEVESENLPRFCIQFKNVKVKEDFMYYCSGDGETLEDALKDYVNQISGKLVVFYKSETERIGIKVPMLFFNIGDLTKQIACIKH